MLRQLSYSASHDALTHLANRASFEKQLRILLQTVNGTSATCPGVYRS
ncbi:hypothetical protein ACLK11_11890 [Escherichia coli]